MFSSPEVQREHSTQCANGCEEKGAKRWTFMFPMRCCSCAGGNTEQRKVGGGGRLESTQTLLLFWEKTRCFPAENPLCGKLPFSDCFYLKYMGAFTLRSLCQWEKMSCFEREPVPWGLRQRLRSKWIPEFQASAKWPICSTEQQTSYKQ